MLRLLLTALSKTAMKKLLILLLSCLAPLALAGSQIICRVQPTASPWVLAAKYHVTVLDTGYNAPFVLFGAPAGADLSTLENNMSADPGFVWVETDESLSAPETESKGSSIAAIGDWKAVYSLNKGALAQVNWSAPMAQAYGRKVRVAILDTGLSPKQPLLWGKVVFSVNLVETKQPATDWPRHEDSNANGVFDEATGHGTMVAGIINMMAPQAQLVVVRVADSDGTSTAWRIIKGLTYAVAEHAEVANVSLGSVQDIVALDDVLDWTDQHGLLICAPDGNNDRAPALFPAQYPGVLAVAGVDPFDHKASFSNWDLNSISAAPATGVKSFWWDGTLGVWSGTSFAAPFVAGAIADALKRVSPVAPADVLTVVRQSGKPIDRLNPLYAGRLGSMLDAQALETAMLQFATWD